MDYVGRLMLDYKWSFEYVAYELPMLQGWVWYSYAMENNGWLNFAGVKRKSNGYIGQSVEHEQAKNRV